MTKKLFWQDPYQTELRTTVTSVNQTEVTLQETIFFAFSGGQESDLGTIDGIVVTKAIKNNLEIVYSLDRTPNFKIGDSVVIQIDWPRRYSLMKLHFAAELVLVICQKLFPAIEKIGAHISQDKSRIDFLWTENLSPHLEKIKNKVQVIIDCDLPIISDFSDELTEKRFWQIEGIAKVPCGGTHPKSTKELGVISLRRDNCGKNKERLIITLLIKEL